MFSIKTNNNDSKKKKCFMTYRKSFKLSNNIKMAEQKLTALLFTCQYY